MNFQSPWLTQLEFKRSTQRLNGQFSTDVAVIGAGIAGIMTAYYLLERTDKSVIIIEADKIAHGATGHNAGQVTSYFERHFVELVEEFGLEKAAAGQAAVEGAWGLLSEVIQQAGLTVPLYQFTGYAGFSTLEQIIFRLEEEVLRQKAGLTLHEVLIANDPLLLLRIPDDFSEFYKVVDQTDILRLLETDDDSYIGLRAARKGCLNSALFCEQVIEYAEAAYGERLTVFEQTPVRVAHLGDTEVRLEADDGSIICQDVVLCTNGFENIELHNESGLDINGRFHERLIGTIGYMAGYLDAEHHQPTAISYFEPQHLSGWDPYMYLTRRPQEQSRAVGMNLLCIGGPEVILDHKSLYNRVHHPYPEEAQDKIQAFLLKTYQGYSHKTRFDFLWHGLMGYTTNGVRLIGQEPCNQRLYYNLGCNGVGILPSIYGGYRISQLVAGEKLPPSLFDVQDQRCVRPS